MQKGLAVPDATPHLSKVPLATFLDATEQGAWQRILKTPFEFFVVR
jgi:hypothetical protein